MRQDRTLIRVALFLTAALFIALTARHLYRRRHYPWKPPLNTGLYTGPLDRTPPPYDHSKSPSRPWVDAEHTAPPLTTYHAYASTAIGGRQTDCLIYFPPGYGDAANSARRYPVVYWLHGYSAAPQWGMPFVETLDAAIHAGVAPPIIAILPNGLHDSWYVDSADGAQPVESIIIKDLIPHIDATFRTQADRRFRAVEGFSMGAWGAAHLALKYPDLFCAATLISAPLHPHNTFPQFQRIFNGSQRDFYAEDPVTLARRNAAQLSNTVRVRIFIGDQDYNVPFARAFDEQLEQDQFVHQLTLVPRVGHDDDGVYQASGIAAFGFYRELFP